MSSLAINRHFLQWSTMSFIFDDWKFLQWMHTWSEKVKYYFCQILNSQLQWTNIGISKFSLWRVRINNTQRANNVTVFKSHLFYAFAWHVLEHCFSLQHDSHRVCNNRVSFPNERLNDFSLNPPCSYGNCNMLCKQICIDVHPV